MYRTIIVDDESWIIKGLELLIDWENFGFLVTDKFTNSIEAMTKIKKTKLKPDLVITDIKMAGMSGLELVSQIKIHSPTTKFLMISGFTEFEYAHNALKLGVTDYLLKPIESSDLVAALSNVASAIEISLAKQVMPDFEDELKVFKDVCGISSKEVFYNRIGFINKSSCYSFVVIEPSISTLANFIRFLDVSITCSLYRVEKENILLAINYSSAQREYIDQYLYSCFSDCRTGISGTKHETDEVYGAFEEASIAFHAYFINPSIKYYTYKHNEFKIAKQFIEIITSYFNSRDFQKIHTLVDTLPKSLSLNKINIKDLHAIYNHLANCINNLNEKSDEENLPLIADYMYIEDTFKNLNQMFCSIHDKIEYFSLKDGGEQNMSSSAKHVIPRIKEFLDNNYQNDITLSFLSKKFVIDERYLSRLFKECTNENFIEYLNHVRIKHAQLLLLNTEMTIQDISYLCGYNDYFYFTKVYKKITGTSPSIFRLEKKPKD